MPISFKQFFYESGFKSFIFLPETQPYGFVIWPDGTFKPVKSMYKHADVAGGEKQLDNIIKSGGMRVSQPIGDDYFGDVLRSSLTAKAKKTALDIANFYNVELMLGQYMVESTEFSTFTSLPDTAPHGFWITKQGNFIIVPQMFGHDEVLIKLYPELFKGLDGYRLLEKALKLGFIRMAKMGGGTTYGLTTTPRYTGPVARKTAKDIAQYYQMGIEDDFEGL